MKLSDQKLRDEDRIYGVDLPPRHESWARISVRGTFIGFVVFLVLAGLFLLWLGLPR